MTSPFDQTPYVEDLESRVNELELPKCCESTTVIANMADDSYIKIEFTFSDAVKAMEWYNALVKDESYE